MVVLEERGRFFLFLKLTLITKVLMLMQFDKEK